VALDLVGSADRCKQPHCRWTGRGSEQSWGIVGSLGDCGVPDLDCCPSVDFDNIGKPDVPFLGIVRMDWEECRWIRKSHTCNHNKILLPRPCRVE